MLYSFLLAQLAADKRTQTEGYQYSRHTQLEHWVDFFDTVLMNIAWTFQAASLGPTDLAIKDAKFKLSNLALEIMSGNSMAGDVNTFKKVFSTYNALSSSDSAVKAFTKSAYDKAAFKESRIPPLVHSLTLTSLRKSRLRKCCTLNQELYAKTRQKIADRLKPYIKDDI